MKMSVNSGQNDVSGAVGLSLPNALGRGEQVSLQYMSGNVESNHVNVDVLWPFFSRNGW